MPKTQKFANLIEAFLKKYITALEFEKNFLSLWNETANSLGKDACNTIEDLFYSVDAYTNLPLEPTDNPDNYINEDQLRKSAKEALRALKNIA